MPVAASTGCLLTGVLTGNAREKIHRRGCRWMQKVVIFRYSCADFQESDALDAAALTLHRRVDIELQRCFDVHVTQHFADAFDICAVLDTPCGERMPKGMEPPVTDAAAFQKHGKLVLTRARIHRSVAQIGHNISVGLHTCGIFPQQE